MSTIKLLCICTPWITTVVLFFCLVDLSTAQSPISGFFNNENEPPSSLVMEDEMLRRDDLMRQAFLDEMNFYGMGVGPGPGAESPPAPRPTRSIDLSDDIRGTLRLRRMNSTIPKVIHPPTRKPGYRRKRLFRRRKVPGARVKSEGTPKDMASSGSSEIVSVKRRVPNFTRKALDLDRESRFPNANEDHTSAEQRILPHPSFTNYGEPFPVVVHSTYEKLADDTPSTEITDVKPDTTVYPKPAKKYYPIFRKPKTTAASAEEEGKSKEKSSEEIPQKKYSNSKNYTTPPKRKGTYRVTSKINPQLFSLKGLHDLDKDASANPFLDTAAPISSDLGDHSSIHSLHSLLNADSVLTSQQVLPSPADVSENNTSSSSGWSTTLMPPYGYGKPRASQMPDDLMLSDEMAPVTTSAESVGSTESSSAGYSRVRKKSPSSFMGRFESSMYNPPVTTTSIPETTTQGTTEPTTNLPASTYPPDTIIVTFEDPPVSTTIVAPISTFSGQTSPKPAAVASASPTETTTEASSVKVQREISTVYPTTVASSNLVQEWSTPHPNQNQYDLGTILNRFLTPPPPTVQPQAQQTFAQAQAHVPAPTAAPTPVPPYNQVAANTPIQQASSNDKPIMQGLLDSLNSIYSLFGPVTPAPASPILFTTPRPFSLFGGNNQFNGPTTQSPLQKALSNMINVFTNPFGTTGDLSAGKGNLNGNVAASQVSNSLTPLQANQVQITTSKPAVPLNPTDYLNQLLKLGSDLGGNGQQNQNGARHISAPAPTQAPTIRPLFQFTTARPLFDFTNLFSGNWLGVTTTPAPILPSLNILSLLTALNPFANLLTTRQPFLANSLFSASASNQQSNVFATPQPKTEIASPKSGLYYWLDSNMFIPGQDPKASPTTGIRPKLGQRDFFLKVR